MKIVEFLDSDFEIRNRPKLDRILVELCRLIIKGQNNDPMKYGMVAACVLDPQNRIVFGVNEAAENDTRRHAERVAIDRYVKQYGEVPDGSIIITTLSPCNEYGTEMADDRYGESCTDLINDSNVKKVYCGYTDPSQTNDHEEYTLEETKNGDIKELCKKFADTFLDELVEGWSKKYKSSINCNNPKGFSQRAHCQGRKKEEDYHPNDRPPGPETKPTMPAGTVKVDVSDVYDWYKLGMHISDLKGLGHHDFGQGPPSTIFSFGSEDEEHQYIKDLQKIGLTTTDIDPIDPKQPKGMKRQKVDPTYNVGENFADGKNPQDKGDSKRHGVPTKASISTLRKVAKQGGRKGQLAHWMANMKAGKAKKK